MQDTHLKGHVLASQLRSEIGDLFVAEDITIDFPEVGAVRFRGRFQGSKEEAHLKCETRFAPYNLMPIIRQVDGQDVLIALPIPVHLEPESTEPVATGRPWVNVVLFLATTFTVLMAGAQQNTGNFWADILSGWPFALGLLGILLTHEFGHYFAAKYHGMETTLPYFIPMPLGILGTFGAVIVNRSRMQNRRALLDLGAAGPLAGLIVAVPVLLVGLALSKVDTLDHCTAENLCYMEGNSILYLGLKYLVFGRVLPSDGVDVMIHPLAFAGWAGILVTSFNLIPVGTLDGGHIVRALLGKKARVLYWPVVLMLAGLGFLWPGWWLWAGLVFVFGRMNAVPLDDSTPLDFKRKVIAVIALAVFVLTFTPLPLTIIPSTMF